MAKKVKFELSKFLWRDILIIMGGTALYALGITKFLMPHKFVTGGLAGVAILFNYSFNIPVSLFVLVVNITLIAIALRVLGFQFLLKTIIGVFSLSSFIGLFENLKLQPIMENDPMVAGLIGAILCGAGVGWVLSVNGSTGGTDIIVMLVSKYRNVTPGRVMLFVDLLIVSSSFVIFQSIEKILYGIIILAVVTTTVDFVINGVRQSVQFFIFSRKYGEIADAINIQLHRGCTVLDGMGWYSKEERKVLVVLAKKAESVSIFRLVKNIDPNAFISQSSVNGVYGEGFDMIKGK